jgi:pyrroloquinoline quinone (PQQ) biosynthesis protein C
MMDQFIQTLEDQVADSWAQVRRGQFWQHVLKHGFDHELYVALMTEVFQYTKHNAQNQALAAVGVGSDRVNLMRFCLHHAFEEAGHDGMVLRDLKAVGVDPEEVKRAKPLPETEAFISYLYRVASTRDATARLGYSYWAENCYGYIKEILDAMRRDLSIGDKEMTFFVAHAEIDTEHFEEVQKVVGTFCTTRELQEELLDVLKTTLHLQGQMLEAVYQVYVAQRQAVAV